MASSAPAGGAARPAAETVRPGLDRFLRRGQLEHQDTEWECYEQMLGVPKIKGNPRGYPAGDGRYRYEYLDAEGNLIDVGEFRFGQTASPPTETTNSTSRKDIIIIIILIITRRTAIIKIIILGITIILDIIIVSVIVIFIILIIIVIVVVVVIIIIVVIAISTPIIIDATYGSSHRTRQARHHDLAWLVSP